MSRRLPLLLLLTLVSGLAIGAAGALVVAPRSATAADPGITDRAALEALLAEPSIALAAASRSTGAYLHHSSSNPPAVMP